MANAPTAETTPRKPLRLWPGVAIAVLLALGRYVLPLFAPETLFYGVMGGLAGALAILLWWLFFSRAPWSERLGAVALMVVAVLVTSRLVHVSIATGAMGMLFWIFAVPLVALAFVAWAVASRRLTGGARWATLVAAIGLACGAWTLVRTGGFSGDFRHDFAWRWTPTPEERLLAQAGDEPLAPLPAPAEAPAPAAPEPAAPEPAAPEPAAPEPVAAEPAAEESAEAATAAAVEPAPARQEPEWPGFRGGDRDSVYHGAAIATDWAASPPVELWRRPVGPAWSSFAVDGDVFYTQEQRGDEEVVACYRVATGEPVWMHRDAARFWESNAGAGPRGTPTLHDGRVYSLGGTGILNALEAADGAVVWSRNAATDVDAKVPYWGFSSSPIVTGDLVIVAVPGQLVAYDLATGAPRWRGPAGPADRESYSSPHLSTIDGVEQILLLNGAGAISLAPADGAVLWEHAWKGFPIVQPALTEEGDVLISVNMDSGTRRLALAHDAGGWRVEERWTSTGLKPYFNDFVVHEGHAYGFDNNILASIELANGERKWKGGRYGNGQLLLLADQDLLLVLTEQGELALVAATPDRFTELARLPAIEGKTWNHPVLAGDVVLARNAQEMVAFRLARASG